MKNKLRQLGAELDQKRGEAMQLGAELSQKNEELRQKNEELFQKEEQLRRAMERIKELENAWINYNMGAEDDHFRLRIVILKILDYNI